VSRLNAPAEAAKARPRRDTGLTGQETEHTRLPGPSHYQTPFQNALIGREAGLSKSNMQNAPRFSLRAKGDKNFRRVHQDETGNLVEVIEPNLMRLSPGVGSYETSQAVFEKHIHAQRRGSKGGSFGRSARGLAPGASTHSKGSTSSLLGSGRVQPLPRVGGIPPNVFIREEQEPG
jgi:hypothetical protein